MISPRTRWRSWLLATWTPTPGITRRIVLSDDGEIRVMLGCGDRVEWLTVPPGAFDLGAIFVRLGEIAERLQHASFEAFHAEEARQQRVLSTIKGIPRDVKLRDLDDKGKLFAQELRMLARRHGIVTRTKPEKAEVGSDLEWPECSGK